MRRFGAAFSPQRGAVTAEVAVALPALVVLLSMLLGAVVVGTTQLRLEEAARAGAREIMRGESPDSIVATVRRIAGDDARLELSRSMDWSTVTVRSGVRGPLGEVLEWELSASASARPEASGSRAPGAVEPG